YRPINWLKLSSSIFYSKGTDFLYYVSTGDSIDMGFGDRPIMIRSNISDVRIYGLEFDFTASPLRYLNVFGNYAYSVPKISDYKPLYNEDPVDLSGKYLTDVPKHSLAFGAIFQNKEIVNMGITCKYVGEMFVNDQNVYDEIVRSNVYPSTFTVDIKLSREFVQSITTSLSVQNIFDKQVYDSKGAVGPGRFIIASIGAKF
ncbi:MAG TPA: TonB-dependent receptor, partial [Tenuifilaceae bacterium]|nr:TonB-dependent receptor [Tenuifilaceae bacterium]